MGFLDDIGHAATQLRHGLADIPGDIGNAAAAPFGFVMDLAAAPWDDDEDYNGLLHTLKSRGLTRLSQLAGGVTGQPGNLKDVAMGTLGVGNALWEDGISRGGSTLIHAAGVPGHEHPGAFLNPQNWREAWNASEHITVGAAAYDALTGAPVRAARGAGEAAGLPGGVTNAGSGALGGITDADFDMLDPEQVHRAFETGIGKAASTAAEFGIRWYADPLVIAGQAAGALRAAKVVMPVHTGTDLDAVVAGKGAQRFTEELFAKPDPAQRMDWLLRNKVIQNTMRYGGSGGPALAHLLATAKDPDEAAKLLRLAMDPTARNSRQLARVRDDLEIAVANLRDTRIPVLERMLADPRMPAVRAATEANMRQAQRELAVLESRYTTARLTANAAGTLRSAPRVTLGQRASDVTGFAVYQPSRYNMPMRMYKSALTRRGQTIDLNRPADAAQNVRLALDRVGHGMARGQGFGFTAAEKGELELMVGRASGPAEVQAAVAKVEDRIAEHYASRLDLDPDPAKAAAKFKAILELARTRRDEVLSQFTDEAAFSGARWGGSGRFVDQVGEDGVFTRLALSRTDLANKLPMIDVDRLARVAKQHSDAINAMGHGDLVAFLNGMRASKGANFTAGMDEMLTSLNRLWKPMQLMRLGWPIRVLVDEQLRIMSQVGAMAMLPLWGHSIKESALETRAAMGAAKVMDAAAAPVQAARGVWPTGAREAALRARREAGKRKFSGTRSYTRPDGTVVAYDDVFAGRVGEIMQDLVGSNPDFRALSGVPHDQVPDVMLGHLRYGAGIPTTLEPVTHTGDAVTRAADKLAYEKGWEKAANEQMGQDPLFRQILAGRTDPEIVAWLRGSKEGRALRRALPVHGHDPQQWVERLRVHVDHYLPTQAMRDLALQGKAKIHHLEAHFPEAADRPVVHGESLMLDRGTHVIPRVWNRLIETLYKNLGSAPTNVLSRHPFAAISYRSEMDRQIAAWPETTIPHEAMEQMRHNAREYTIGRTRELLYELSNTSNAAHTLRFITPFYQAWQEVLTTWGRLSLEDPSRLVRLTQLWDAPSRLDMTYTDPSTGTEYVAFPHVLAPLVPKTVENLAMPKDWMRQLVFNNDYWYTPGVGPTVQVPLGEVVRHKPTIADNVKFVLPYGAGESALKDFMPTSLKRLTSLAQKDDDRAYAQTMVRITQDLVVDRNLGKNQMSDTELRAEAVKRTNAIYSTMFVGAMGLPFTPKYRSPYQFYIDQARTYRETYEGKDGVGGYPDRKDTNGKTWREAFYDKFGQDFFVLTESLSKSNTGLPPTEVGHEAMAKYGDLIAELPKAGGLFVSKDEKESGQYSDAVYDYQIRARVGPGSNVRQRELLSPEDMVKQEQLDLGWDKWTRANKMFNAALHMRGMTSMSDPGARDLLTMKRNFADSLAGQYPAWGEDRRQFETGGPKDLIGFLNTHAADPRLDDRPGFASVRKYLRLRKMVSSQLKTRAAGGGAISLEAESNKDLKGLWDMSIGAWVKSDIDFDEIYSRWLDQDRLLDGG